MISGRKVLTPFSWSIFSTIRSWLHFVYPAYQCVDDPLLGRKVTAHEYELACEALDATGLQEGWVQELDADALDPG